MKTTELENKVIDYMKNNVGDLDECLFCGDADVLENGYCFVCNETAEEMGFEIEDLAL